MNRGLNVLKGDVVYGSISCTKKKEKDDIDIKISFHYKSRPGDYVGFTNLYKLKD